jgi:hypothetical protein
MRIMVSEQAFCFTPNFPGTVRARVGETSEVDPPSRAATVFHERRSELYGLRMRIETFQRALHPDRGNILVIALAFDNRKSVSLAALRFLWLKMTIHFSWPRPRSK